EGARGPRSLVEFIEHVRLSMGEGVELHRCLKVPFQVSTSAPTNTDAPQGRASPKRAAERTPRAKRRGDSADGSRPTRPARPRATPRRPARSTAVPFDR